MTDKTVYGIRYLLIWRTLVNGLPVDFAQYQMCMGRLPYNFSQPLCTKQQTWLFAAVLRARPILIANEKHWVG